MSDASASSGDTVSGTFPRTRWSLVLDAQEDDPAALAELCRAYWFPLFCFARRLRPALEDAKDLTQGFFEMLLSRQGFKTARSDRGKLRSFLVGAMKNYSADQHRRGQTQKRGGGLVLLEFDAMEAESRYAMEPRDDLSPEREFDRAWARQLLASVLSNLGEAYRGAGKGDLFAALQGQLTGGETGDYAGAAAKLGMSPASLRFAAFKLRERYRAMLRNAIKQTVTSEAEVAEELAHLRGIFGT